MTERGRPRDRGVHCRLGWSRSQLATSFTQSPNRARGGAEQCAHGATLSTSSVRNERTLTQWTGVEMGISDDGLDQDLMVEVWRIASRAVLDRPWLLASWLDTTPNIPHVVVHDGPLGAALHFDKSSGPYWSGGFTRRLSWAEVTAATEPEEWKTGWGSRNKNRNRDGRAATYLLISAMHARWVTTKAKWTARPAPILSDGPDSVFELAQLFPSANLAVSSYLEDISREGEDRDETGGPAYWHEPFWLLRRDGEPKLLLDEAGVGHLPVTSDHRDASIAPLPGFTLVEIMKAVEYVTSRAAQGFSFDLSAAFDRAGGPGPLSDLCDDGVLAVILALESEPPKAEATSERQKVMISPLVERDHWGWDYGDGEWVMSWFSRSDDYDVFEQWHRREHSRRAWTHEFRESTDRAVESHLRHNLLPAAPLSMMPVCIEAISLAREGRFDALLSLPPSVTFADQHGSAIATRATVREIIRQHSLSGFAQQPHRSNEWGLEAALSAWSQADRGEWELPSPAPSWPEYVTVLLVGRNHLVPGVEDDPSEQDQLREWWDQRSGDWRWDFAEPWWSKQKQTAMTLPGADPRIFTAPQDRDETASGSISKGPRSPRIVVLTGAGLSAESGIPTFRDANGLWEQHRIEDVASATAFARDSALVNRFYDLRRRAALNAHPGKGHHALAELEEALGSELLVVTQNVDDLHERAGSRNVLHIHGELNSVLCTRCGRRHSWFADLTEDTVCPTCAGHSLRPDIVWFGESVHHADQIYGVVDNCEIFVVIGTSGAVHPAAGLARRAHTNGAVTILLNLERWEDGSDFDDVRLGPASTIVAEWASAVLDDFTKGDSGFLDQDEVDEAGGFSLIANATLVHLTALLDRASRSDDPSALSELSLTGAFAWKYAAQISLDDLTEEGERRVAESWRATKSFILRQETGGR